MQKLFLDTCIVNWLVTFGEYYFDNCLDGEALADYERRPPEDQEDIDALHDIIQFYQRYNAPIYVAPSVIEEVMQANEWFLESYAYELFQYWWDVGDPEVRERLCGDDFEGRVRAVTPSFCGFKRKDQRVLAEALIMGCNVLLTVDRRTIWKRRDRLPAGVFAVQRPVELWGELFGGPRT